MNISRILRGLPNDRARGDQCLAWAERERDRYFQGQRETQDDVVRSTSPRYRGYSIEARREIGHIRWSTSILARSIADDEAMYSRWAQHYHAAANAAEHHEQGNELRLHTVELRRLSGQHQRRAG